jgi:hypothetical protein
MNPALPEKSIAVLPLEDVSREPNNASLIRAAETILRNIWLDGQSDIPRDEYTDVMRKLWNWPEKWSP